MGQDNKWERKQKKSYHTLGLHITWHVLEPYRSRYLQEGRSYMPEYIYQRLPGCPSSSTLPTWKIMPRK